MTSSRSSSSDIIVVGSGIAGLATALALARGGQKVGLLGPRAPLPAATPGIHDPRVYAISPASQQLLASLGIWDLIPAERVAAMESMEVFGGPAASPRTARPGRVGLSAWQGGTEALSWIVESREIERALRQAVTLFGIAWTVDTFTGMERRPDGRLSLRTSHGTGLSADLAIGADGAHSPLREAAGLAMARTEYDATGLVVHLGSELAHRGMARQWFTPDGVLALLPMPDADGAPQVSMVWSMRRAQADALLAMEETEQRQVLLERLARATGKALGDLQVRSRLLGFPLALQTCPHLVAPGIALVGDAAHLMHPLAGQGLNMGLGDVGALAQAIAQREAFRAAHDLRVLKRYQRARAEPLLAMRAATDGLYRLFDIQAAPIAWMRNAGMDVVENLPFFKRLLIGGASGF